MHLLSTTFLLQDLIGLLGGDSELSDGGGEGSLGLLGLLLHQHDSPSQGGDVSLHFPVCLVLFLVSSQSFVEFVRGLIKLNLEAVNLFAVISDVTVGLVSHSVGLLGSLLELVDDGVQLVRLVLQGL